ncbi:MAG TPA: hypothetical protein VEP47_01435 [Reyranella sp.]|nr:hypothetical protein [Reyranella sp.]
MLHRLERGDRPAELHAHLGISQRILAQPLGDARHLVGQADRGLGHGPCERAGRAALLAQWLGFNALELQPCELAGPVHGFQRPPCQPFGVARDREQRQAVFTGRSRRARQHDDEIGRVAVEHEALVTVEVEAAGRGRDRQRRARRIPASVVLHPRQRRHRIAGGNARQQRPFVGLLARVQDSARRQHGCREIRRADQGAAHLLQHDAELAEAEALAIIGFGDAQRRQAELAVELAPAVTLPAGLGLHQPPDFLGRRAFGQQAAQVGTEFFLFGREVEFHGMPITDRRRRPDSA